MKEILIAIAMFFNLVNYLPSEPPAVNTEGLCEPPRIEMLYTDEEVYIAAQMICGEAGSDWISDEEMAKVLCVACNRLHNSRYAVYGDTLTEQITYPYQFVGWHSWNVPSERHLRVAYSVLWRDSQRQQGCEGVPWETNCCAFYGANGQNHFY